MIGIFLKKADRSDTPRFPKFNTENDSIIDLKRTDDDKGLRKQQSFRELAFETIVQAGRVIKVRGSGSTALVTVKYGDDIQIKYLAQYILKVPAGGSDSGAAGLSGLAELLAGRLVKGFKCLPFFISSY